MHSSNHAQCSCTRLNNFTAKYLSTGCQKKKNQQKTITFLFLIPSPDCEMVFTVTQFTTAVDLILSKEIKMEKYARKLGNKIFKNRNTIIILSYRQASKPTQLKNEKG